ncbi:uncharacterized protein BT62DRAFT_749331 [Guyanagaster necrorhizus]|uniref:Uncharacterized protein n=1 Tax=Guyanagaster necrorhizus TaxID=856835 RepID=A0A9P8AU21_9AGAR|nr:uncharacterized protein BT62DRAFT_749331 [Guyanagaster necrorhizus MCA 3950]KAG7448023.1 hypothetical protein BT62DRAFT_749331 [Guyanagaster necrorhizus MCA 3950]
MGGEYFSIMCVCGCRALPLASRALSVYCMHITGTLSTGNPSLLACDCSSNVYFGDFAPSGCFFFRHHFWNSLLLAFTALWPAF